MRDGMLHDEVIAELRATGMPVLAGYVEALAGRVAELEEALREAADALDKTAILLDAHGLAEGGKG